MSDTYKLEKQWDDETASYEWRLYRTFTVTPNVTNYRSTGFLGLGPTVKENIAGESRHVTSMIASGDDEWAKRVAEHYKIELGQ
jgi:hypothetical protein